MVQPYTGFCVGLTKTCVGVSETWPPYTSSRIALTEKCSDFFPFLENEGGNGQKNFPVKNGRELLFKSEL